MVSILTMLQSKDPYVSMRFKVFKHYLLIIKEKCDYPENHVFCNLKVNTKHFSNLGRVTVSSVKHETSRYLHFRMRSNKKYALV